MEFTSLFLAAAIVMLVAGAARARSRWVCSPPS